MGLLQVDDLLHASLKQKAKSDGRQLKWHADQALEQYLDKTTGNDTQPKILPPKVDKDARLGPYEFVRTTNDLAEIRRLEANRDDEMNYCQDAQARNEIHARYADQLQPLWDEYDALKGKA